MSKRHPKSVRGAFAVAAAAALALAGCSSNGTATTKTAGGLTNVIIQTAPGNVLPYIGYLADHLGYFKKNGINASFATLTTGLSSTAALNAGSLNVIFADPATTGPLMAQGTKLRMILGEQSIQWRILVPAKDAGTPLADLVKTWKAVGAPAASGGTAKLVTLIGTAYGLPAGSIKTVADQSGAGVLAGAEQAIAIEPAGSCVLEETQGLKEAFSFAKPIESSYPAALQQAIGIPDIGYWTLNSWAAAHPDVVKGLQAALTEAEAWANNPANLSQWVTIMRGSPLNLTSLTDSQYRECLANVQGSFGPNFSTADAATWSSIVKIEGSLPSGLPDPAGWLDPNVPATAPSTPSS